MIVNCTSLCAWGKARAHVFITRLQALPHSLVITEWTIVCIPVSTSIWNWSIRNSNHLSSFGVWSCRRVRETLLHNSTHMPLSLCKWSFLRGSERNAFWGSLLVDRLHCCCLGFGLTWGAGRGEEEGAVWLSVHAFWPRRQCQFLDLWTSAVC